MDAPQRTRARQPEGRPERQEDLVELATSLSQISTDELDRQQARRVADLKARIQSGAYRVDSRQVAEKMLANDSGI